MNLWKLYRVLVLLAVSAGAALAAAPAAAGVLTGNCRTGEQPSATLLVPFFEVDLARPQGRTTLVSINNASARSTLARVVLWTNWGIPTLAFDVYLTGFDAETIDLRDLFAGRLPQTGTAVSPVGTLSQEEATEIPGCDARRTAGAPLKSLEIAELQAAHTGRPVGATTTEGKLCAGTGLSPTTATGYITVDSVVRCTRRTVGATVNTPVDREYFSGKAAGVAGDANVLWGDAFQIDAKGKLSFDLPVVHIPADPEFFAPGDYTFYGRYTEYDASDHRVPLSSLYYARFAVGGPTATELIVWRDTRQYRPRAYPCSALPAWAPLGEMQLLAFDEEENGVQILDSNAFPLATQKVRVGDPAIPTATTRGWLMLDLWHRDGTHAQGWVGVLLTAEGRTVSYPAIRADDMCNFGI
jgi:hypothetical protein